jgi:uncharacterized protein YecT (DUF1311 family)
MMYVNENSIHSWATKICILVGIFVFAGMAFAASFDCAKVTAGSVESLICANKNLSELDEELQAAYTGAMKAVDSADKSSLAREQRNWIKYLRNICASENSLDYAYRTRIDLLLKNKKHIVDDAERIRLLEDSCQSVVYLRDPSLRIVSFNKSLAENNEDGEIIGCSQLIDLPVGTANGNHGFGGYCTLRTEGRRKGVMICDDDMVGHFAMKRVGDKSESKIDLVNFTNRECFGGWRKKDS